VLRDQQPDSVLKSLQSGNFILHWENVTRFDDTLVSLHLTGLTAMVLVGAYISIEPIVDGELTSFSSI
jgi:hypothetical protein